MSDTVTPDEPRLVQARQAIAEVCDPEIPVLTLDDLGVVRDISLTADGTIEVMITPTYSGCPAMTVMELDLHTALARAGFANTRIKTILTPAWSSDWMSAAGHEKLRAYGIAPPIRRGAQRALFADEQKLPCPRCASNATQKVSEFGSTACKAHWRCEACLEPFDAFKCI